MLFLAYERNKLNLQHWNKIWEWEREWKKDGKTKCYNEIEKRNRRNQIKNGVMNESREINDGIERSRFLK